MNIYKPILKILYKRRAPRWTFELVARLASLLLILLIIMGIMLIPSHPVHATEWWQSVAGKTPVVAYKAFGIGSQAASYVNLADPGTYDAWPARAPTWNSTDGWIFNGLSQYIDTGIEPQSNWTILVRYSNATLDNEWLFGITDEDTGANQSYSASYSGAYDHSYWMGNSYTDDPFEIDVLDPKPAGVVGISEFQGYFDGLADGDPVDGTAWTNSGTGLTIFLGCFADKYLNTIRPQRFMAADIQAVVIYDQVLSSDEMATISSAMADLTGGYPTDTPTITLTFTPSNTTTITKTFTPTASFTPTETFTLTPSYTPSETATATSSLTPTSSPVPTDTRTPTITRTPIPAAVLTGTYEAALVYYTDIASSNAPNVIILSILCGVLILGFVIWAVFASQRRKR